MPEHYRVLVVDDEPADRFLYRISLTAPERGGDAESTGPQCYFEAMEAASGWAGIECLKTHTPDCIVLDYHLPDIDGIEFIQAITTEWGGLPCAVIMLTGAQDERIAVRAMKSGATDYIPKTEHIAEILPQSIVSAVRKFRMSRQIEEQRAGLAASERKYRALLENTRQLVWLASRGGTLVYANRRWSDYTGLAVTPDARVNLNEAIFPGDREAFWGAWTEATAFGVGFEIETRLRRNSDGRFRWHLVDVIAMQEFEPDGAQWLGTCTDIENNKQAEQALQETKKWESIGLLAGGIAHDFNNLLLGILGGASFLSDVMEPSDSLQPILATIIRSGQRAAQLTQQMLAYSGRGPFFVSPVDLLTAVREATALITGSVGNNVVLAVEVPESLPTIETDPNQIRNVITNLVINAAEAIPPGAAGTVTVRVYARYHSGERGSSQVVLEVQDDGIGMDAETVSRVFDPFFTTKFTGRGLGLAAVQGIVRSSRGSIEIESEPGKGSSFRVIFPASPAVTLKSHEDAGGTETANCPPGQAILVIDDEEAIRTILKASLERAGFQVQVASSGEEGLHILRQELAGFALVVLDLGMPGMSGKEVLEKMKEEKIAVPVVVCSGFSEREVLPDLEGLQTSDFIQKPFLSSELITRIREVLKTNAAKHTSA